MTRHVGAKQIVFAVHAFACVALVGLVVSVSTARPKAQPAMPNLIVRGDVLSHQWVVRDEDIAAACSAEEGSVTPGVRRIVRFTVMTPNIGSADIRIGDPNVHVAAGDGLFEFATCHQHYHFRHYALYELVGANGYVWRAAKRGFCMLDTDPNPAYYGRPPRAGQFRSCGAIGIPGNQGISAGWADTYRFFLGGQYFVLDGGDGQPLLLCPVIATAWRPPAASAPQQASVPQQAGPVRFELTRDDVLIDEIVPIVITGLSPRATVTVRVKGGVVGQWSSSATFTADETGRVDVTRMAPTKGSYKDIDAMGLFWSAERGDSARTAASEQEPDEASPDAWTLTAEVDGRVVAQTTVRRRNVAPGVRISRVRTDGLVGTYYEPTGGGRHPAFIVLGGSGGGISPPAGPAGGLASRGYAVLALAYFGAEGLPRALSNIPLEYFGAALNWLGAQPSVDPTRIGVLGVSRGAELALLLGAMYPAIHAVVAYVPSNVVNRGCCDQTSQVAWTIGGRALAPMPRQMPARGRMQMPYMEPARPEIQVENIKGPILLISGKDDGVWPSAEMAGKVMARLRSKHFEYAYESLVYDKAGHAITRPYASTMELDSRRHPLTGRIVSLGGTPAGTAKAREDSWRKILAFVDQHLRDARPARQQPSVH